VCHGVPSYNVWLKTSTELSTPHSVTVRFAIPPHPLILHPQFLAQLKLMDYSLLVGIHDVERAEQEEVESEDNNEGGEEEGESDGGGVGTPPDSPSNTLDSSKPLAPGEFDPTIDVYAIKSSDSESVVIIFSCLAYKMRVTISKKGKN